MFGKTITINAEVDVDIEDLLTDIDTEDLMDELDRREVEYDMEAAMDKYHIIDKLCHNNDDLYRHLCDIVGVGYHEPKDSLLNKLKEMI